MSRKWSDCHKGTELRVRAAMAAMKALGYPMFVCRTFDSPEKQLKIYARGRTLPGEIVTWTKQGWHNLTAYKDGKNKQPSARAVDLAFRQQARFPGRKEWSYDWPWDRLHKIARALGLSIPLAKTDKGHLVDKQSQSFKEAWKMRS